MDIRPPHAPSRLREGAQALNKKRCAVVGFIVIGLLIMIVVPSYNRITTYLEVPHTPHSVKPDLATALQKILLSIPQHYLQVIRQESPTKTLALDIKYKHVETLAKKRQEALKRGILVKSSRDYVPATLTYDHKTISVQIRLKGDLLDHLEGKRWSFRVKTKKGATVLGMRKFSLQAPYTRGYQGEPLFLNIARSKGILAPRSSFVNLVINGENIGVMNLEESFSKELLESQLRKSSPILKFDEDRFWQAIALFGKTGIPAWKAYINWRNTPLLTFQQKKIESDTTLKKSYHYSRSMVEKLADNLIAPQAVFDEVAFGKYLAICELFQGGHMTHWNNMRFYANPYTAKLEPIVFDANVQPIMPVKDKFSCVGGLKALTATVLNEPHFAKSFLLALKEYSTWVLSPEFETHITEQDQRYRDMLRAEYPWLPKFDLNAVQARARQYQNITLANLTTYIPPIAEGMNDLSIDDKLQLPALVYARIQKTENQWALQINNLQPFDVIIKSLDISTEGLAPPTSKKVTDFKALFPLTLKASQWPEPASRTNITIPLSWYDGQRSITGISKIKTPQEPAAKKYDKLYRFPIQIEENTYFNTTRTKITTDELYVSNLVSQYPFISFNTMTNTLTINKGNWLIDSWLTPPQDLNLTIKAGATLRFSEGSGIILKGSLIIDGQSLSPVTLVPNKHSWAGLAVISNSTHKLKHVSIKGTQGVQFGGHQFSGGVTFYQGRLQIQDLILDGSTAEDALNLVNMRFAINNLKIFNARSDALDIDFSHGTLRKFSAEHVGGDGLDISGSELNMSASKLSHIHDKAISVGEGSTLIAADIQIETAGTGIASKDSSVTKISNADIRNIQNIALMAFQKKQEYGPAKLYANKVTVINSQRESLAQTHSLVHLNGEDIASESIDIDALYQAGYMRK
ncbi:MAG: CotH kinase family protein [Pseudomonadales bacterium]|nr:CotH kinase family protein [Pseudomonadales bacterium]